MINKRYIVVKDDVIQKDYEASYPLEYFKLTVKQLGIEYTDIIEIPHTVNSGIVGRNINEFDNNWNLIQTGTEVESSKDDGPNYIGRYVYNKQNSREGIVNDSIYLKEGYTPEPPPREDILYRYTDEGWVPDHDDLLQKAIEKNLSTYVTICNTTDAEINKYNKRQQLDILFPEDELDYENALQQYKEATIQYKTMKTALLNMSDEELLQYYLSEE